MSINQLLKPITTERKDVLYIGECNLIKLAEKYGTPLYVIDEVTLRQVCKEYKEAFKKYPLALLLHEADLEATYFFDIPKILPPPYRLHTSPFHVPFYHRAREAFGEILKRWN